MIRDTLLKIRKELPRAMEEEFVDHPLAQFITDDAKNIIHQNSPTEYQHFTFKGSPGISQWATNRNPWIGIFHPITHPGRKLASQGYYIVYGFPHNVNYITFGIGQSDDEAVKKFGRKNSKQKLNKFANEMRLLIPAYSDRRLLTHFSLGPVGC